MSELRIPQQLPSEGLVEEKEQKPRSGQRERMESVEEGRKRCSRCRTFKTLDEFHNDRSEPDGKAHRCRQCKFITNKQYYSSPLGKLAVSGQTKRKWRRSKLKVNARNVLNNAIFDGKITKQNCVECGEVNTQAHHEDYTKPLDVIWLCRKHHMNKHGKKINERSITLV